MPPKPHPAKDVGEHPPVELADESVSVHLRASDVVYEGMIWNVRRDRFEFGDGELTREYLDHPGAVAVMVLDEDDRVLLIKQYRHPIKAREWELPAGLLDVAGEDPLTAAKRELAEEVDLAAAEWNVLTDYACSPGSNSEIIRIYLARGLSPLEAFDREAEEADMELRWVSLDDALESVVHRKVQNPSLVIGLYAAHLARSRGWSTLSDAEIDWPEYRALHG